MYTRLFATNTTFSSSKANYLMALDVLKHHTESGGVLTKVGNSSAGALHDLSGVTLSIDLAETAPLTKDLLLGDLDQRNLTLSAQGLRITKRAHHSPQ